MTDTPTRGPLQPHNPNLMQKLTAEQAKERAARTAGVFEYDGPRWVWLTGEEPK